MADKNKLGITYFRCPKCDLWKAVESQGTVISGPKCKVCRTQMRPVKHRQLHLGLR